MNRELNFFQTRMDELQPRPQILTFLLFRTTHLLAYEMEGQSITPEIEIARN